MKDLKQITVIGLGLLGGSVSLAILRDSCRLRKVKVVGYSHRAATRAKAKQKVTKIQIVGDIRQSVSESDLVILATPIRTFEKIFNRIADVLPTGCIVTDVGSTKVWPHRWAANQLPKTVYYVGSHPIAGSEKRGIDYAKEDLFDKATCILTTTRKTNRQAVQTLKKFWSDLGCFVKLMRPADHDRILANISHLPQIVAAALVNASRTSELRFAGKGFKDTTRIASGPANIWADILLTNVKNSTRGIDRVIAELVKLKEAMNSGNEKQIKQLLNRARNIRDTLIN